MKVVKSWGSEPGYKKSGRRNYVGLPATASMKNTYHPVAGCPHYMRRGGDVKLLFFGSSQKGGDWGLILPPPCTAALGMADDNQELKTPDYCLHKGQFEVVCVFHSMPLAWRGNYIAGGCGCQVGKSVN